MNTDMESLRQENSLLRAELEACRAALASARYEASSALKRLETVSAELNAKIKKHEANYRESEGRHDREFIRSLRPPEGGSVF